MDPNRVFTINKPVFSWKVALAVLVIVALTLLIVFSLPNEAAEQPDLITAQANLVTAKGGTYTDLAVLVQALGYSSIYLAIGFTIFATGLALLIGIVMTVRSILKRTEEKERDNKTPNTPVSADGSPRRTIPNRTIYTKEGKVHLGDTYSSDKKII